jgi:hypothetical protein
MKRMTALEKIERRQIQIQTMYKTLTIFLRSNPFFDRWKLQYNTDATSLYPPNWAGSHEAAGPCCIIVVRKGATTVEMNFVNAGAKIDRVTP